MFLFTVSFFLLNCSKEKCKQCYLVENEGKPDEVTTNLGEQCGDELEDIDGKEYICKDGPCSSYCE